MSKLSKLLQVTDDERRQIREHFNITEEELEENVRIIKEWLGKNAHLPKENDDNKIRMALLNSKMSLEKTKQSLEGYYRVRRLYSDFFDKMHPSSDEYKKSKTFVQTVVMPRLGPDLCRITIFKLQDINGEAEDALIYNLIVWMMAEVRFFNDYYLSNIIIVDMEAYGLKNMLKYTPSINHKLVHILNAINLRIKEVHLVNTPSFIERVMVLIKAFLPAKIVTKIHSHSTYETLAQFIPKQHLPSNYGGSEESIEKLYVDWCDELEQQEPMFQELLQVKSSEEIKKSEDSEIFGMGSEGSFKKLAVD